MIEYIALIVFRSMLPLICEEFRYVALAWQ